MLLSKHLCLTFFSLASLASAVSISSRLADFLGFCRTSRFFLPSFGVAAAAAAEAVLFLTSLSLPLVPAARGFGVPFREDDEDAKSGLRESWWADAFFLAPPAALGPPPALLVSLVASDFLSTVVPASEGSSNLNES